MQEVVDLLRDEHGWSDSVSNLSNKLQRDSMRYVDAFQLADPQGQQHSAGIPALRRGCPVSRRAGLRDRLAEAKIRRMFT